MTPSVAKCGRCGEVIPYRSRNWSNSGVVLVHLVCPRDDPNGYKLLTALKARA